LPIEIDHSGKNVVVTGAGAGIGRSIAFLFAQAGANVAVLDKRADKAQETVELLVALNQGSFFSIVGDAREENQIERMFDESSEKLGGIDIAVNNIGMLGPEGTASLLEMDEKKWRDVIEQNLLVTALSMKSEAKHMSKTESGVIINVSSGETTRPSPFLAGYGAAKAGINHLTQTAAVEFGPMGIRVLAIAPGTTLTETVVDFFDDDRILAIQQSNPLRRMSAIEDLGHLSVFLASDFAQNITGQFFLADAGAHLSSERPPSV
jgi:NAD(P)-dependent dehydrogenase (short-subunit alcohol dehydrogenase family)|tara:strand:+ start:711 stop:1502 length:792 start_codon:yes stop_codon:yes gene_type:complete